MNLWVILFFLLPKKSWKGLLRESAPNRCAPNVVSPKKEKSNQIRPDRSLDDDRWRHQSSQPRRKCFLWFTLHLSQWRRITSSRSFFCRVMTSSCVPVGSPAFPICIQSRVRIGTVSFSGSPTPRATQKFVIITSSWTKVPLLLSSPPSCKFHLQMKLPGTFFPYHRRRVIFSEPSSPSIRPSSTRHPSTDLSKMSPELCRSDDRRQYSLGSSSTRLVRSEWDSKLVESFECVFASLVQLNLYTYTIERIRSKK